MRLLALQIGGFTQDDQTPSFSRSTRLLSFLATGSFKGQVVGMNELQAQETADYGPGDYIPPVRATYWGMRIMAYLGTLVFLVAALGAFLYRRGRLERTRWFLWTAVATIAAPFLAARGLGAHGGRTAAVDRPGAPMRRRRT